LDKNVRIAFEKSQELLKVAELTFKNKFYADSINRSYYAVFHAANALLIKKRTFPKNPYSHYSSIWIRICYK
jgi:uncharacterized protein (UPF0332 family)